MRFLGLFVLVCALVACTLAYQCLDETGKAVDWWFIHKLPSVTKQPAITKGGFAYYYADPNHNLEYSPYRLDSDLNKALGATLGQYMNKKAAGWIVWNDQPPGTNMSSTLAHAKGVMSWNTKGGFFLRHSVPRFPMTVSTGPYSGYPAYARIYGQTFLCVSYSMSGLNSVAEQFLVNDVNLYDSHISQDMADKWPALGMLANFTRLKQFAKISSILSLGGNNFTDFAKSKMCNCELYTQLVAPAYSSNMAVLSWGRPLMGSGCRPFVPYDVLDIRAWSIPTPTGNLVYNETKEHSKLAMVEQNYMICVGDINRMTSQALRGGGTTCFRNPNLWSALATQIWQWSSCN